jgi:sugar lactone lactonase YvrE
MTPLANGTQHHSRLWYADDVVIGPKSGNVYFTDATDIPSDRIRTTKRGDNPHHWDTLYASQVDLIRGQKTGRVIEYNPSTDTTRVLVDGLSFANGIAVDKDETYLIVSQTFGPRLSKYHLKGDQAGSLETVLEPDQLTGYPDGADCAWDGKTKCYAAIPSAFSPIHALYNKIPDPFDRVLRAMLMLLPRWLAPPVQKYGGVVEVDISTKEYRYIQDPTGCDVKMITGVTGYKDKLYLGSLENNYIAVYNLHA